MYSLSSANEECGCAALAFPPDGLSSPCPPALHTGEGPAWAVAWGQEPGCGVGEVHQEEVEREAGGGQFVDPKPDQQFS